MRLFRDVVPLGTFTPTDLFDYLGLDRARFGRLLGGQETDSSAVMLNKRVSRGTSTDPMDHHHRHQWAVTITVATTTNTTNTITITITVATATATTIVSVPAYGPGYTSHSSSTHVPSS